MNDSDRLLTQVFDGEELESSSEALQLRRLKDDLRQLKTDIPECQLSVERLRNAILSETVQRKTPWWNWLTPAAAGLACILAIVLLRDSHTLRETVLPEPMASAEPEVVAKMTPETVGANRGSKMNQPLVTGSGKKTDRAKTTKLGSNMPKRDRPVNSVDRRVKSELMPAGADKDSAELTRVPEPEPAVIVVDTQQDANTGAQQASEVTVPSDVVISG